MTKAQAKGYLYEIFIAHLLKKNSFLSCERYNSINRDYKCGVVSKDGEIKGRGTRHQIDFTGIYSKNIPFVYPIRILTECKYWTKRAGREFKPVSKSFIREYIGVSKDISENYFSDNMDNKTRFLDIPIIFSAGGFDSEAEKLAWAQGINVVSHSEIPILRDVLLGINYFINNIPHKYYGRRGLFPVFRELATNLIEDNLDSNSVEADELLEFFEENILERDRTVEIEERYESEVIHRLEEYIDDFAVNLDKLRVSRFPTFLFATTEYGKLINLISYHEFPDELFVERDEVTCKIYYYEHSEEERMTENDVLRTFFVQIDGDRNNREFYFQGNRAMMGEGFDELPERDRINEKLKFIKELSIIKEIRGLTRIIKLKVEYGGNR